MPTKYVLAALRAYCKEHRIDSKMPLTIEQVTAVLASAQKLMEQDTEQPPTPPTGQ